MSVYKQLKLAASKIEALAADLETAKTAKVAAEKAATEAKLAADKATKEAKTASEKAKAVDPAIAKVALEVSAKLAAAGLITSKEKQDQYVAKLAGSHADAIAELLKVASNISVPRTARVVAGTEKTATANDLWDERLSRAATRFNK